MTDAADPGGTRGFAACTGARLSSSRSPPTSTPPPSGSESCCSETCSRAGVPGPLAPCLRFLGPLALPFRISCSGAPSAAGSLAALAVCTAERSDTAGLSDREGALDPFVIAGGPRASMLARLELKRKATPLLWWGCLCSRKAGALVCFDSRSRLA